MKKGFFLTWVVTLIGVVMLSPQVAFSDSDHLPPLSTLSAEWWQWAVSIPPGDNPMLDETGKDCMIGQRGSLWFLAGFFLGNGTKISRTCSVPEGTTLYFPVINTISINIPNVCGQTEDLTVKEICASNKVVIDSAHDVSVKVDNKPANDLLRRVKSDIFAVALPEDNVFNAFCGGPGTVPAGVFSPSGDDGYYVLLKPLKPGHSHTIHFHAEGPSTQDVTYELTVVPVSLK